MLKQALIYIFILSIMGSLTGCGIKGPLYMPEQDESAPEDTQSK